MTWRLAQSLIDLRDQANAAAPNRSKASDGTIGDARHQAEASRHNPNAAGVVTAFDLTHDPAGGMDTYAYCVNLVSFTNLIPNDLDYVISNRQIASRERGWAWRAYSGVDPHTNHAHFGVGRGPDSAPVGPYDDPSQWHFPELLIGATPSPEDELMSAADDINKHTTDVANNLATNIGDAANNIVTNLRAYIAAHTDPKAVADAIAKELPAGSGATPDQVEAAVRKVFADAGKPAA